MQMYVNIVCEHWSGHVQKHIGKLLFDNVSELKSTQFREGRKSYKGIRGVAGLTRTSIRKIPGDYGRAIRGNVGDVGKMKKSVMAIWKHRSSDHSDCGD